MNENSADSLLCGLTCQRGSIEKVQFLHLVSLQGHLERWSEKTNKTVNLPRDNTLEAMPKAVVLVAGEIGVDMNRNIPKQEGLFRVAGNNWGLACPFEPIVCQRGYCDFCEIYHNWQRLGEIVVICAWCSQVIDRKPSLGKPVVSHGICRECVQKYFPQTTSRDTKSRRGILRFVNLDGKQRKVETDG